MAVFCRKSVKYRTISMSLIDINQKKFCVKMSKVKVKTNNKEDQALEVIFKVTLQWVSTLTVMSLNSVLLTVTYIFLLSYCIKCKLYKNCL